MDPQRHDDDFFEALASASPTPGGGVAAARAGRLGCALLSMVGAITLQRASRRAQRAETAGAAAPPSPEEQRALEEVQAIHGASGELASRFRGLEDADRAAFESYLEAARRPRGTESEKAARSRARAEAARIATEVPLETMEAAGEVVALGIRLLDVAELAGLRAESDLFGALELALATFRTAELNVRVNWSSLDASDSSALLARWEEASRAFQSSWAKADAARSRLLPDPRESRAG